jgi:hypothetical protein
MLGNAGVTPQLVGGDAGRLVGQASSLSIFVF